MEGKRESEGEREGGFGGERKGRVVKAGNGARGWEQVHFKPCHLTIRAPVLGPLPK